MSSLTTFARRRAVAPSRQGLGPLAALLLLLAVAYFLVPVYIMFKVSVSSPGEILRQFPAFWIEEFTWRHWEQVLTSGNLWAPLRKSLVVATGATLLTLLLAVPAAYAISRLPPRPRYTAIIALFFTRMFPDVGVALPIAVIFLKHSLLDTDLGLILAHTNLVLPLAAWVLVGTFNTIPRELEQAAEVDGASRLRALWSVALPLARPGIAVAAIFVWLASWNEFTYAMYLTLGKRTLPLLTYYYITRGNWFQSAAYSAILTIPVLLVTLFLQRYLRSGYLSGSLKG